MFHNSSLKGIIAILIILCSLVSVSAASEDEKFIDFFNMGCSELSTLLNDWTVNDMDKMGLVSDKIYTSSDDYYEKIVFLNVSSKFKDLKDTFLEILLHYKKMGTSGRKASDAYNLGNNDLGNYHLEEYRDELYIVGQLLAKCELYSSLIPQHLEENDKESSIESLKNPTAIPIQEYLESENQNPKTHTSIGDVCDCSSDLYNCKGSFPLDNGVTEDECYKYCINQGYGDIHGLDKDKDGDACEPEWG